MANDSAEAVIRLLGKDDIRQLLGAVNGDMDRIIGKQDKAKASSDAAAKSALTWKESWALMAAGAGGALSVVNQLMAGISSIGDAVREAAAQQNATDALAAQFKDAGKALNVLRQAASERLPDSTLAQLGAQAGRLGFTLEQTQAIFAAAASAAAATGKDAAEVTRELIKGAAEGSDEMLRNLGVLADLPKAQASYAASMGLTVDQLNRQQKASAALDATVAALGTKFAALNGNDALVRVDRMHAKWENFKDLIGSGLLTAFNAVYDSIDTIATESETRIVDSIGSAFDSIASMTNTLQEQQDAQLKRLHELQAITDPSASERARAARDVGITQLAKEAAAHAQLEVALKLEIGTLQAKRLEEDNATASGVLHARALAETATALGDSTLAATLWADALRATANAHLGLIDNQELLYAAVKNSNSEMARSIELQAEMAAAAGDTAQADALRAQAAGLVLGDTNSGGGGGGGGGSGRGRKPKLTDALSADTMRGQSELNQMAWDMQSAKAEADAFLQSQARADAEAASTEQLNLVLEQHQAQLASQRDAYDAAGASADRFGEALRNLNGIDLGPLGESVVQLGPLLDSIKQLSDETGKTKSNMVGSVAGIVGASGKIAAGLIQNETAKAAVMSLVETAAGIGSLAVFDYTGAGLHFASAGVYAVVAGMSAAKPSGGGGSGGRGSPSSRGPTLNPSASSAPAAPAAPPVSYTIYMSGATVIGADEQQVGRQMSRILDEHRSKATGSRSAGPR